MYPFSYHWYIVDLSHLWSRQDALEFIEALFRTRHHISHTWEDKVILFLDDDMPDILKMCCRQATTEELVEDYKSIPLTTPPTATPL